NLSSIPLEVQFLLQLGEKFGLPINRNNKEKTLIEFIKHIENNISGRPKNIINFVRNNSISILNRFYNNFPSLNFIDNYILEWLYVTKKFINDHPNILIRNTDKGNATVVLDKDVYVSKMEEILSDTNTYQLINKDPIKKLIQDLRVLLVEWKCNRFIDEPTYRRLLTTDGIIPRAYGLTKIHKDGNPLRVIVPLVDKLNGTRFDFQYVLASLDVVSLFTNIALAVNGIDRRWDYISTKTNISKEEFIIAVSFILDSTFFIISTTIVFYFRYVDDVILALPSDIIKNLIDAVHIFLNNCYPLSFIFSTIEKKIKFHIHNEHITHNAHVKDKHFTIPYIKSISKSFLPISSMFHCKLVFSIVYKISCDDCEASYVGQTKRKLSTRLHEHISDIRKKTGSSTVITEGVTTN
ncbi:hypothetical protein ALC60_12250, partial [Trachymyrmex zeteki]